MSDPGGQLDAAHVGATEPPAAVAQAVAIGKIIDDRAILHDLHFSLRSGEILGLLGANGAGKSTLLSILALLTSASSGELRLFGQRTRKGDAACLRRIGLIAHQPLLYRDLTARENLEFFGRLFGLPSPTATADGMLEMVALAHRAKDPVRSFSRGMVQRVSIARALLHDPALLLADEPFAGLDAPSSTALEDLLTQLAASGKSIILVNHDIAQSLRVCHRVLVLRGGRLVADAAAADLTLAAVLSAAG